MPIPESTRRHFSLMLVTPLALAVVTGCASVGGATPSPEADQAALMERAKAYWELARANDNVGAWAYEAQSKDPRASLEGYLKRGGITYNAVEVRSVKSIEGDTAVLEVWMDYALPLLRIKSRKHAVEDHWKRIDGVWYHAPPRNSMFSNDK